MNNIGHIIMMCSYGISNIKQEHKTQTSSLIVANLRRSKVLYKKYVVIVTIAESLILIFSTFCKSTQ